MLIRPSGLIKLALFTAGPLLPVCGCGGEGDVSTKLAPTAAGELSDAAARDASDGAAADAEEAWAREASADATDALADRIDDVGSEEALVPSGDAVVIVRVYAAQGPPHASPKPVPDVPVMAHQSDGAYLSTTATDQSGIAMVHVPIHGMITAAAGSSGQVGGSLTTWAGVENGDVLTLGDPAWHGTISGVPNKRTITVLPVEGAASYEVFAGCGSCLTDQATPTNFKCPVCSASESADIVAYARDSDGRRFAWSTGYEPWSSMTMPPFQTGVNQSSIHLLPATAAGNYYADLWFAKGTLRDETIFEITSGPGIQTAIEQHFAPSFYDRLFVLVARSDALEGSEMWWPLPALDAIDATVDLGTALLPQIGGLAVPDPSHLEFSMGEPRACAAGPADELVVFVSGLTGGSPPGRTWYLMFPPDVASPIGLPQLDPSLQAELWDPAMMHHFSAEGWFVADEDRDYADLRGSEQFILTMGGLSRRCVSWTRTGG